MLVWSHTGFLQTGIARNYAIQLHSYTGLYLSIFLTDLFIFLLIC